MANEYRFICDNCQSVTGEFLGFINTDKKYTLHKCVKCRRQQRKELMDGINYA